MDKKKIFGLIILLIILIAIPAGAYLIQKQQILKSRAGTNRVDAFELKDASGNTINCDTSTTPPTCTTNSLDFTVRVKGLNPLQGQ